MSGGFWTLVLVVWAGSGTGSASIDMNTGEACKAALEFASHEHPKIKYAFCVDRRSGRIVFAD